MAEISYYDYVTDKGIVAADTATILIDVQNDWQNALGGNLSLDSTTPQGRIIELQTAERKLSLDLSVFVANQLNPNYATGQFLDAHAAIFGIDRVAPTRSLVYANITGEPGTIVGAPFVAKSTAGDEFETEVDVTIGDSGTADQVIFYAKNPGAVPCAAETLTTIVTTQPGVFSVSNPSTPFIVGTQVETDASLRPRISGSRFSREALPGAVRSALNAVKDVRSYWFYNNGEGASVYVAADGTVSDTPSTGAVEVAAHSIILVIEGGDDDEIANALFVTRSAGCGYTSLPSPATAETVSVTDNTGAFAVSYNVIFNRPEKVAIDYGVTVRRGSYTGTDAQLTAAIETAVGNWIAGEVDKVDKPQIGDTVYTYEIGAAISDQIPEIIIKEVKIALHGATLGSTPISTYKSQIIVTDTATITIEA